MGMPAFGMGHGGALDAPDTPNRNAPNMAES